MDALSPPPAYEPSPLITPAPPGAVKMRSNTAKAFCLGVVAGILCSGTWWELLKEIW